MESPIGTCSNGHKVIVIHHPDGEIDRWTIGTETIQPSPDMQTTEPIVIACDACVQLIRERHKGQFSGL